MGVSLITGPRTLVEVALVVSVDEYSERECRSLRPSWRTNTWRELRAAATTAHRSIDVVRKEKLQQSFNFALERPARAAAAVWLGLLSTSQRTSTHLPKMLIVERRSICYGWLHAES